MSTMKRNAIEAIQSLPDNSDYDDIIERIYFMQKVEKGLQEIDAGKTTPHDEVKNRYSKWIKQR